MRILSTIGVVAFLAAGCGGSAGADKPAPRPAEGAAKRSVVALGDSVSLAGPNCDGCTSFVDLFASRLGATADNLAIEGAEATKVIAQLRSDGAARRSLRGADAVVLQIGVNDTPWNRMDDPCHVAADYPVVDWKGIGAGCTRRVTAQFAARLDRILTAIKQDTDAPVAVTTVYNSVLGDEVDPSWDLPASHPVSVAANRAFAKAQCRVAHRHGAVCIDVLTAFNGPGGTRPASRLLAGDHTHPNARGHRVIAGLLGAAKLVPTS